MYSQITHINIHILKTDNKSVFVNDALTFAVFRTGIDTVTYYVFP